MRRFGTLLTLILGLGVGTVLAVPASPNADPSKITQLITKLGSDNFREREAANKELDSIGEPALEALRKAAKSNDMEIANRAAALIGKIEQRGENARLLAPTYVELTLKEATIDDAVAELSKKSGYQIVLAGDKTKFSDRRVTLETGRVPFWKALDMLCQKAGLVEADPNMQLPATDQPIQPVPPVQIQPLPIQLQPLPVKPINIKPINNLKPIRIQPVPEKPAEEKPADKPAEKPVPPQGFSADEPAPQKADPAPQDVPARAQPIRAQPIRAQVIQAQPVQAQPAPAVMPIRANRPMPVANNGNVIVLVDGKSSAAADVESAIRIRAITDANLMNNYGGVPQGEIGLLLEVKAEPKIQLQQILGVKIDKAIDNYDQTLTPTMVSSLIGNDVNDVQQLIQLKQMQLQAQVQLQVAQPIGGKRYVPVYNNTNYAPARLKKGDKESKSLKEVRGTVSVKMRTGNEELVAIENILKAKGESVKGKGDAVMKIVDVSKAENGDIAVAVELTFSNEVQPQVNQPGMQPGVPQPIRGGIQIQIAPAQPAQPAPLPPMAPNAAAPVNAQPAVYNYLGLDLLDAKGESLKLAQMQVTKNQWMGNGRSVTTTMTFKPQEKQEAAKLVFRGTRAATVDVPFLLKDVPLK